MPQFISQPELDRSTITGPIRIIFRASTVALLASVFVFTTACNTLEGAGEDIESGGEAIQDAAD